MLNKLKQKCI